jgi:hypothetical protein
MAGFFKRLKERVGGRLARDKEEFWKPRAIAAINEIDWELLYVDDSYHPSQDGDVDDREPSFNRITPERVLALGEVIGYDKLTAAVREKKYLQDLYWDNETDRATSRWLHRTEGLPSWFWWYHGVNS